MILIISRDKDFFSVVAEKLREELKLDSRIAANADGMVADISCVIAGETLQDVPGVPLVTVAEKAPVRLCDLLAEVRSAIASADDSVTIGPYRFSPCHKSLERAGAEGVTLTDKEVQILQTLLSAGKEGIAKEALLKSVWGFETAMDTHTLETHIYRLRAKLKTLGEKQAIAAVDGGYVLKLK